MNIPWQDFHFIRPQWLLLLIPLLILVYFYRRLSQQQSGWQGIIAGHLYSQVVSGRDKHTSNFLPHSIAALWVLATLALAGPTWERLPQPVYQLKAGQVVVIDMSMSMRATDISPDRLTRAKYKAIDLVKLINEGETGLVAYAGDAYTISPLTADYRNLASLLPSLSPEIMPVPGSDPLSGFLTASDLLENAGYQTGRIFWITDGVENDQMAELQTFVSDSPFTVHILGVGTEEGAPIAQAGGELLKDSTGQIVIPKLNENRLARLAGAAGGKYVPITAGDQDVSALANTLSVQTNNTDADENEMRTSGDKWQEMGPYLIVLCLPLLALMFRRGVIFSLFLMLTVTVPDKALAQENQETEKASLSWWQKAFNNADEQGDLLYQQEAFSEAAQTFESAALKGAAEYKAGNYEQAAQQFSQLDTPEGHYNRGNALAHLQQYESAIEAYDEALSLNPDYTEAKENKALVEEMLKQQQQQQQQQDDGAESDESQSSQDADQQQSQQNQSGQNNKQDDNAQSSKQNPPQEQSGGDNRQSQPPSDEQQNEENQGKEMADDKQSSDDEKSSGRDKQSQPQSQDEQQSQNEQEAQAAGPAELTEAEKENMERLENLKRRIPDDPAYLLKRKMQLEAQQRQQRRPPRDRSDW